MIARAALPLRRTIGQIADFLPRFYRQRIGVRLVIAHLFVAVLTIIMVQAALIAALFGWLPNQLVGGDDVLTDYTLGEKARTLSTRLELFDNQIEGDVNSIERGFLMQWMRSVASDEAQVTDDTTSLVATGADSEDFAALSKVANALLTDENGIILATSDPTWAPVGSAVEVVGFDPVARVTREALAGAGQPNDDGESYVLTMRDRITVASHVIQNNEDQVIGVVTLQGDPYRPAAGESTGALFKELIEERLPLILFSAVAALALAIPFGVWHARGISRRLARVANAADAMASGNLSRRVMVHGEDEVARLSDRFNEMAAHIAANDRARRAFVANVSHELRTPVAIIQGHLERLMQSEAAATPRQPVLASSQPTVQDHWTSDPANPSEAVDLSASLEAVQRETATLNRLIDDLFTMARLEEASLPMEVAAVNLYELANQAAEGIRGLAWGQRRVAVQSLIPPTISEVRGDRTRLRQILNNLLYNALRHTPEGGLVLVNAVEQGRVVEVSVTDTGSGIDPAELDHVFDRFYRGERTGRHDGGSGLGLHIVKQLVEAQGGSISVRTETDQGTTFRFAIPKHKYTS